MRDVYIRLAGGLGNQLFQLAAGLHVVRGNTGCLKISLSGLSAYAVAREPDALRLLSGCFEVLDGSSSHLVQRMWIERIRLGRWPLPFCLNDRSFAKRVGKPILSHVRYLDGYFQSGWGANELFSCVEAIKRVASFPELPVGVNLGDCAIHIRGGDFLRNPVHDILSVDFYREAVRRARAEGAEDFVVITDDRGHASTVLADVMSAIHGFKWRFLPQNDDCLVDFVALMSAPMKIIGNSTFAWWACMLDFRRSIFYSPKDFVYGVTRDYFAPWEVPLDVGLKAAT